MSSVGTILRRALRRVLAVQFAITCLLGMVVFWFGGTDAGFGALYGGSVAMMATGAGWTLVARRAEARQAEVLRGVLVQGAITRFAVVLVGFSFGLGVLHLAPAPMVMVFAACQIGYAVTVGSHAERMIG